MYNLNIQDQIVELTDDQLELVEGGGYKAKLFKEFVLKPRTLHFIRHIIG